MRKTYSVLLSLSLALTTLCTACSGSGDVSDPADATQLPTSSPALSETIEPTSSEESDTASSNGTSIRQVTETPTQFGDYQLYLDDSDLYVSQDNGSFTSLFAGKEVEWSWTNGAWCDGYFVYVDRTYIEGDYVDAEWEDDNGLSTAANYHRIYAVSLSDGTIVRMSDRSTPTALAYGRGSCLYWTEYSNWNCTSGSTYVYDTATGETTLLRAGWCVEGGFGDYLYGEQEAPGDQDPMPASYMDFYSLTDRSSTYLCDLGEFDQVDDQSLYFFSLTNNQHSLTVGKVDLDGTVTEDLATVNYNGWDYGVAAEMKDNASFYYNYLVDDYSMTFHTYLYNFDTGDVTEVENEYLGW